MSALPTFNHPLTRVVRRPSSYTAGLLCSPTRFRKHDAPQEDLQPAVLLGIVQWKDFVLCEAVATEGRNGCKFGDRRLDAPQKIHKVHNVDVHFGNGLSGASSAFASFFSPSRRGIFRSYRAALFDRARCWFNVEQTTHDLPTCQLARDTDASCDLLLQQLPHLCVTFRC